MKRYLLPLVLFFASALPAQNWQAGSIPATAGFADGIFAVSENNMPNVTVVCKVYLDTVHVETLYAIADIWGNAYFDEYVIQAYGDYTFEMDSEGTFDDADCSVN